MRKQLFEELAKFYGIEIQYDSQKGGLYYADSDNIIKKLIQFLKRNFLFLMRKQ